MARQLRINYPGAFFKKIGEQFKISESAVSHAVSRVSKTIAKDKKVRKKLISCLSNSIIQDLRHDPYLC
jgi:chromosomal replication initiation ATPase DnaA